MRAAAINLRALPEQRDLIDHAAGLAGQEPFRLHARSRLRACPDRLAGSGLLRTGRRDVPKVCRPAGCAA